MRITKSFLSLLIILMFGSSVFAAKNSYIKITSHRSGDSYYAYNDSINEVKITITGSVSSDCTSIRALWTHSSFKVLEEYLVHKGKNPGETAAIDDVVLSKYKKGDTSFIYNMSGTLDNLEYGSNYYKFVATFNDGSIKIYDFEYYVHTGGAAEKGKPVIYLYPQEPQNVDVKVSPKGGVTKSIPQYNDGWSVFATPQGELKDLRGDSSQTYPYLFWESDDNSTDIDMKNGFVVETKKLNSFFEEKLSLLGLNEKEIADFVEFWVPELQGKKYVFITFYSQERIDQEAPLSISPAPDTVIRVFFDHKKLDKKIKVKPQELTSVPRNGFTVVEWGGKRYK